MVLLAPQVVYSARVPTAYTGPYSHMLLQIDGPEQCNADQVDRVLRAMEPYVEVLSIDVWQTGEAQWAAEVFYYQKQEPCAELRQVLAQEMGEPVELQKTWFWDIPGETLDLVRQFMEVLPALVALGMLWMLIRLVG